MLGVASSCFWVWFWRGSTLKDIYYLFTVSLFNVIRVIWEIFKVPCWHLTAVVGKNDASFMYLVWVVPGQVTASLPLLGVQSSLDSKGDGRSFRDMWTWGLEPFLSSDKSATELQIFLFFEGQGTPSLGRMLENKALTQSLTGLHVLGEAALLIIFWSFSWSHDHSSGIQSLVDWLRNEHLLLSSWC